VCAGQGTERGITLRHALFVVEWCAIQLYPGMGADTLIGSLGAEAQVAADPAA
jgi:hypothetical protein